MVAAHGISPGVLLVELIMSADRIVTASESVQPTLQVEPDPDETSIAWNPPTVLGHLADVDSQVWMKRISIILDPEYSTTHPEGVSFPWWEPDPVETQSRYSERPTQEVAADFLAGRTALLMSLKGLSQEMWHRTWRHESRGELTLTDLVLWILEHDEEHRATLLSKK